MISWQTPGITGAQQTTNKLKGNKMKLNVKGLVFVGFAAAVFANAAQAAIPEGTTAQAKTVTSVKFTEDTYQKKLTPGTNIQISDDNVITATDTNTEYNDFAGTTHGLVPQGTNDATKFLNGAGGWTTPTDTTYNDFGGSAHGLVPASTSETQGKFLKGDGSWGTPTDNDTTYNDFAGTTHGLVPQGTNDATKFLNGAGGWTTPTDNDTTYNDFGGSAHGLVPASTSETQGKFLKGDGSWGTPTDTTYNDFAGTTHGLVPQGTNDATKFLNGAGSWTTPTDTNTTYTADEVTVHLNGTEFQAKTTGGVADGGTNLTTGDQVYDFVTGLIPGTLPSTCNASNPCALVYDGSASGPAWVPIQQ
jgi:hypothetical protein